MTVPQMLTVAECGKLIRRSPEAVRRLITTNKLHATRLGDSGPWLIFAESVCRLLGVKPDASPSSTADKALRAESERSLAALGYELRDGRAHPLPVRKSARSRAKNAQAV